MESFEYEGNWWLPGKEENKVNGKLNFNPNDRILLELSGSFGKFVDSINNNNNEEYEIILGTTSKGKDITLYRCFQSNFSFSFSGYMNSKYIASMILEGHHFDNNKDIKFNSMSIRFSNLEEWVGLSGFEEQFSHNPKGILTENQISFRFPEIRRAIVDNIEIATNYRFKRSGDFYNLNLVQSTFIEIKASEAIDLNDLLRNYLNNLRNFLTLAIGVPIYPLLIKCRNEDISYTYKDEEEKVTKDIKIYYSNSLTPITPKKVYDHDMLFCLRDIEDDFQKVLNNWFSKAEVLNPVYDQYFATIYNSTMYINHKFLSLIQALESYHRRQHGGTFLPEEEFENLINEIGILIDDNLEDEYKNVFKQKLIYLNEYSLRKRINQIFQMNKEIFNELIKNKNDFVNDVVNTRNYLTHYDNRLKEAAKRGLELYELTKGLQYMLQVCLMHELEFPKDKIINIINSNRKFSRLEQY